jgi:hypothetical protein
LVVIPWERTAELEVSEEAASILKIPQTDFGRVEYPDCGEKECCGSRAKIILGYLSVQFTF